MLLWDVMRSLPWALIDVGRKLLEIAVGRKFLLLNEFNLLAQSTLNKNINATCKVLVPYFMS
jgi:hypothetical protein